MKQIRLRVVFDLTVVAKSGWQFDYNDDGELCLVSSDDVQDARRDTIIREMLNKLQRTTVADAGLAWHIDATDMQLDVDTP